MRESRKLAIALGCMILLSLAAFGLNWLVLHRDFSILSYHATLYPNGTLEETYVYRIEKSGKFHFLYRNWSTPIDWTPPYPVEHITPVNVSVEPDRGYIKYATDHVKRLLFFGGNFSGFPAWKVNVNEVGVYSERGFKRGTYTVKYVFNLYPLLHTDGRYYLLKFSFKENDIDYGKVKIKVVGRNVHRIETPPYLKAQRSSDGWVIEGRDWGGLPITAGIFFTSPGEFPKKTWPRSYSLENEADSFIFPAHLKFYLGYIPFQIARAFVLLFPAMFLALYYKYGREKWSGEVPEIFLPPKRRRAWIVRHVFMDERSTYSLPPEVLTATILQLEMQGLVKIDENKIKVLGKSDDPFENGVLTFLDYMGDIDGFDTERFGKSLNENKILRDEIEALDSILRVDWEMKRIADLFIEKAPKHLKVLLWLLPGVLTLFFTFSTFITGIKPPSLALTPVFFGLAFLQGTAAFAWEDLLGKWKGEFYKEKVEWESFRKTLLKETSIAKIQNPDDMLWKEWVVYGMAMGLGGVVLNNLKKNLGSLTDLEKMLSLYRNVERPLSSYYTRREYRGGGGGRGGGIPGGGGFGGGGAGAR